MRADHNPLDSLWESTPTCHRERDGFPRDSEFVVTCSKSSRGTHVDETEVGVEVDDGVVTFTAPPAT